MVLLFEQWTICSTFTEIFIIYVMGKRIIEICANSAQSCVEAEKGGAVRVELCASMPEGGTTPSYGEILSAHKAAPNIDINVIIRPRGGDFLYTPLEIDAMIEDIKLCKELKLHGVVFGCLTADGMIDLKVMKKLIDAACPLSVTCHRAFDVCRNPFEALEQLIDLGCDRILTSGQQSDAIRGIPLIKRLVEHAADRIIIMPGCGVRVDNIEQIERETGAKEFHSTAQDIILSQMIFRNENVPMGSTAVTSEFETVQTDRHIVEQLVGKE